MSESRSKGRDGEQRDGDDGRARKKKRKKAQAPSRWPYYLGIAGVGIAGLVVLAMVIWVAARFAGGGSPAKTITAWDKISTDENEFGFDYPAGWRAKTYGLAGRREIDITGPAASIAVKENLVGSIIGDIAGATGAAFPEDDERLPVAKVHAMRCPQESRSYKEEPATTVTTRFGKARRSAYVDGSRRGYRATILMTQTALDVFCECRESDWETLRPAFERMIGSIGLGGR